MQNAIEWRRNEFLHGNAMRSLEVHELVKSYSCQPESLVVSV
jgi:hypothetical protein